MLIRRIIAMLVSLSLIILPSSAFASEAKRVGGETEIYHSDNQYMKIALTFDDGPHPYLTPKILDILDEYGIKATFFVIGINAERYPDALCETIKRGHEVGNHTYTHPRVSRLEPYKLKSEMEKCESAIYGLADYSPKLFRPPEGLIDYAVRSASEELDYQVILWDIDTMDWARTPAEQIAEKVINEISSGAIILMHDYIGKRSPTPEALRLFIPVLIEKGYKFVSVSELIGSD